MLINGPIQYKQRTLNNVVSLEGIGVHTGKSTAVRLIPAKPNTGICFKRSDLELSPLIPALANQISSTQLSTCIGKGQHKISTIEHLMAALYAAGIDNLIVEVSGPEMPIMDGSSKVFIESILSIGIKQQAEDKRFFILKKPIELTLGNSIIKASPSWDISFECYIEFNTRMIGKQSLTINTNSENFVSIFDARTFCLLSEWESLKSAGLGLGGSLDNAIVVDRDRILNPSGLRHDNEFVMHKLLDAMGDFYLLGKPLLAHYQLEKPGHAMNACFTQFLLQNHDEYLLEIDSKSWQLQKNNLQNAATVTNKDMVLAR